MSLLFYFISNIFLDKSMNYYLIIVFNNASFLEGDFSRISQKINFVNSRVYARVLQEGWIKKGDLIREIK
jgi:hypothetical protein